MPGRLATRARISRPAEFGERRKIRPSENTRGKVCGDLRRERKRASEAKLPEVPLNAWFSLSPYKAKLRAVFGNPKESSGPNCFCSFLVQGSLCVTPRLSGWDVLEMSLHCVLFLNPVSALDRVALSSCPILAPGAGFSPIPKQPLETAVRLSISPSPTGHRTPGSRRPLPCRLIRLIYQGLKRGFSACKMFCSAA